MIRHHLPSCRRKGAIIPLAALMVVFILGMVAFSVDLGYIVLTHADLQNTADAAALAGAQELMNGYVRYTLPGLKDDQKTAIRSQTLGSARSRAREYAGYNGAGGVSSLTLLDSDIELGFTDKDGNYSIAGADDFPNTIRVIMRRDEQANGKLRLFFAPLLGTSSTSLRAVAAATLYGGTLDTLTLPDLRILPMTYDEEHWDHFVATGKDPDGKTSQDADGSPQLKVYPSIKDTGNFGQLSLDGSHAGSSEIRSWIDDGLSASDITSLKGLGLIPLSSHDATRWDWIGNPGMKASTVMDVNGYQGETFLLPLFKAKNPSSAGGEYEAGVGQGSRYYFNITRFVGVQIKYTSRDNKEILVQPAPWVAPVDDFDPGSIAPVGTTADPVTTFVPPRLSQ